MRFLVEHVGQTFLRWFRRIFEVVGCLFDSLSRTECADALQGLDQSTKPVWPSADLGYRELDRQHRRPCGSSDRRNARSRLRSSDGNLWREYQSTGIHEATAG